MLILTNSTSQGTICQNVFSAYLLVWNSLDGYTYLRAKLTIQGVAYGQSTLAYNIPVFLQFKFQLYSVAVSICPANSAACWPPRYLSPFATKGPADPTTTNTKTRLNRWSRLERIEFNWTNTCPFASGTADRSWRSRSFMCSQIPFQPAPDEIARRKTKRTDVLLWLHRVRWNVRPILPHLRATFSLVAALEKHSIASLR